MTLKSALNHYWNLNFHYANSVSLIQNYGNFKVTLKMVPDQFENHVMAYFETFVSGKVQFLGTLTGVNLYIGQVVTVEVIVTDG